MLCDFRQKGNRWLGFDRFYKFMLATGDFSPDINVETWIANEHKFPFEQRCTMALFHGATYAGPCESMIATMFPVVTPESLKDIEAFFVKNKKRLLFSPDCRYRKIRFEIFLRSIAKSLNGYGTLGAFILSAFQGTDYERNYLNLQALCYTNWQQWGRMGHWCFSEALFHFTDAPIAPPTMEFSTGASHRSGWAFAIGRDDLTGDRVSKTDCQMLEMTAVDYVTSLKRPKTAFFSLETACCNYKRQHHGTRYGGCYVDEQHDEIQLMRKTWPEMSALWDDYFKGRAAVLPKSLLYENFHSTGQAYRVAMNHALKDHGRMPRVEAWTNGQPQVWI
jgi:hypothetical protein